MQRALVIVFLFLGCGESVAPDAGADAPMRDAGPSCTGADWSPTSGTITRWPEPALLVDDATTGTGVRLRFDLEDYAVLAATLGAYRQVFTEDLGELDGFGINAEAYFTFTRAFDPSMLPQAEETSDPRAGLGIVVISPGEPRIHPVLVDTTDDGRTILMAPLFPLPARAEVAAFVTTGLAAATGGCLEQSAQIRTSLASPDARASAALDVLRSLGVIASTAELAAFTAFPTQSIEDDTLAVVADIESRAAPTFVSLPECVTEARWVRCDARFTAQDYRDADGVFRRAAGEPATPTTSYEVPVTFWLPLGGTPPYPTMFFGHGLGEAELDR